MLRPRIIPCLLIQNKGLVKTVGFKNPKYIGDPINAVKIFNEKEVDEILILDIDATKEKRGPDFEMIKNIANECRMPLCYGGGISSTEEARKVISLGVEKIALNNAALDNLHLIEEIGKEIGLQSLSIIIDVRRNKNKGYDIYQLNGSQKTNINFEEYLSNLNKLGVGEVIINSIDEDGRMQGYDLELVDLVWKKVEMPITILGGAGSYNDLKRLIEKYKIIGVAAGSLFVFNGKFRAVLINYPDL